MFLFELTVAVTQAGFFQLHNAIGGPSAEAKQIAMQPIPKMDGATLGGNASQFHGQWAMAGAGDVLAQLLFVRRKDADAAPAARDGHIPLLRACCGFHGRIGKQDVIHGFAL
jgi:hypothetical protein